MNISDFQKRFLSRFDKILENHLKTLQSRFEKGLKNTVSKKFKTSKKSF